MTPARLGSLVGSRPTRRRLFRLSTLGSVDLRAPDDRVLDGVLAQPKRLALLVYLAAARSAGFHRRDRLVALFWPELDDARARDALSQALRFVRQALGSDAVVTRGVDEVGVDRDRVWCDAVAFRAALDEGRSVDALQLYRGDFLDGVFVEEASGFEEWVESERAALRESAARGARQLAEHNAAGGSHTVAVGWGRRAVELAPDDERAFRRLLGLLDHAGDRAGALQAYDGFARRLRAEYGVEPAAETRAIVEAMRRASGMPAVAVATPPEDLVLSPDVHRARRAEDAATASPLALGSSLANGNYVVEGILGSGGMATVYLAHDVRHDRRVAVKVLRPEIAAAVGAKGLLREIRIAASLQHPHIVPLFDSGESGGQVFYVMPRIVGESLRARLHNDPALPLGTALRISRDVADALAYAHRRGIVHRDIKPDNILLSDDPATGELHALVADFGIAKAIDVSRSAASVASDGTLTAIGGVMGTPRYMAPEQAIGGPVDCRSDLYAWGVVTYEMITQKHPFGHETTPHETAEAHLSDLPIPPRERRAEVSGGLSELVMRCLSKDPAARPADGLAVLVELRQIAGDNPQAFARRRRMTALVTAAVGVVAVIGGARLLTTIDRPASREAAAAAPADTSILVLLPLEIEGSSDASPVNDALLHDAFGRWTGIVLVDRYQLADAASRRGTIRSGDDAALLAADVGAGRYVRGLLQRSGKAWRAYATLFDVTGRKALHQAVEEIPPDPASAAGAYARLAESLLLRGSSADSVAASGQGTRSLPALQAVLRAHNALDEWDLAAADSSFEAAVSFDPGYTRASLWLAQIRAWRNMRSESWASLAQRARANGTDLSWKEQRLAEALSLLAAHRFADACQVYDQLRQRHDRDFASWFGLGQCRTLDHTVIRDPSSPTGWRYRSSYHAAIEAYTHAFLLLPSVHRGYERGAFESLLRILLLVRTDLVVGYGPDSALFHGRPGWLPNGDTLALIPYPWRTPNATPPGFEEAQRRLQSTFRRIAAGWSAAFPRSAGAKQAVALAMELVGDPAAIDTIRLAQSFALDTDRRRRLVAAEVLLRIKFGVPSDLTQLRIAQALGDSLLRDDSPTGQDATVLGPLAAAGGRCDQAERLARRAGAAALVGPIPPGLLIESQALVARVSLGCIETSTVRDLANEITRQAAAIRPDTRGWIDEALLFRPALLSPKLDSSVLARLATSSNHQLVAAAVAFTQNDVAAVRVALTEFRAGWRADRGPATPDMVYPGARLLVAIGDTAAAIEWLDHTLNGARTYDPRILHDPVRAAAFVRSIVLRADIAAAISDATSARRWASAAAVLWSRPDAELAPTQRRMSQYASQR